MNAGQRASWLWRIFATALACTVFGIGGVVAPVLAIPPLFLLPGGREKRQLRARRMVHGLFHAFVHFMRALGLLTWRIEGKKKLQRPGLLILANHPTLLDVVFLVAFVPNATCMVKSSLRNNLAMRGLIKLSGYITNDEGQDFIASARNALRAGSALIIFPEGTRTRMDEPISLQRGAANIAVRCGVDITPVIIHSSPPTLGKEHKWYHVPDRPVVISFSVREDIPIAPFTTQAAALGSRKLTNFLEKYFTRESQAYGGRKPQK